MKKKISIVIPVYNEKGNLPVLAGSLQKMITAVPEYDFEVVFVDDGSSDNSLECLEKLIKQYPFFSIVSLTKNVGSHIACHAGLEYADGDYFAVIAADMQDPPDVIPAMLKKFSEGVKIVWGVRKSRADTISVRFFSRIYYQLMKNYVFDNMPEKGADIFIIDRDARNLILRLDEKDISIFGLLLWSGYSQVFYEYDKQRRAYGESKWTYSKKIKLFVDSFVSFSYLPIRMISAIGIITSFLTVVFALYTLIEWYYTSNAPQGYTTMMLVISGISSIQLLILGVLGEYLWRAFEHIKKRPLYLSKTILRGEKSFSPAKDPIA